MFTMICPVFSPEPGRKTAETRESGEREAEEKKEEVREGGRREEEEVLNYLSFLLCNLSGISKLTPGDLGLF